VESFEQTRPTIDTEPKTCKRFSEFPVEVRCRIWKWALPRFRTIGVFFNKRDLRLRVSIEPVAILTVNREARALAQRFYSPLFQISNSDYSIPFDLSTDTLLLVASRSGEQGLTNENMFLTDVMGTENRLKMTSIALCTNTTYYDLVTHACYVFPNVLDLRFVSSCGRPECLLNCDNFIYPLFNYFERPLSRERQVEYGHIEFMMRHKFIHKHRMPIITHYILECDCGDKHNMGSDSL
jgi:hypothetical protein